jgi:hypothetical protein
MQMDTFMDVRGWKTLGQKLTADKVKKVVLESPRIGEAPPTPVQNTLSTDSTENSPGSGDEPQLNLL